MDLVLEQHRLVGVLQERTQQAHSQDIATLQNQVDTVCLRVYELANIVREQPRRTIDPASITLAPGRDEAAHTNGKAFITGVIGANGVRGAVAAALAE